MTTELPARPRPVSEPPEEIVQFVFRATLCAGLLGGARALLDAAPRELAESFEQAIGAAGLAS